MGTSSPANLATPYYKLVCNLTTLGEKYGLKDAELREFVQEQVKIAQDKAKAKQQAHDVEMRRLKLQREIDQQAHEREMAKLRQQLELSMQNRVTTSSHASDEENDQPGINRSWRGPRMPVFDHSIDDIDAYLNRFERVAEHFSNRRDDYAPYLKTLLRGKARDCCNRLATADARNYDKLKAALLHKFGKTDQTYDDLRTFMVRNRFLDSCDEMLASYLRERNFSSLDEMATAADNFIEARKNATSSQLFKDESRQLNSQPQQEFKSVASVEKQTSASAHKQSDSKQNNDERVYCNYGGFRCISKNCPSCREPRGDNVTAACTTASDDVAAVEEYASNNLRVVGGLTVVENSPCLDVDKLCIAGGTFGSSPVKCMRGIGSTSEIIRAKFVRSEELVGLRRKIALIDGTICETGIALVQLDWLFYKGPFECFVVNSPPCDVVVGNVVGATGCEPCGVGGAGVIRRMASKEAEPPKPLIAPRVGVLQVSVDDLSKMQRESVDHESCFKSAESGEFRTSDESGTVRFVVGRGMLMRVHSNKSGLKITRVVVPSPRQEGVLELSHDAVMSGHLGANKTLDRLSQGEFYWPDVGADVTRCVRSRDVFLRVTPEDRVKRVPLQAVPIVGTPSRKVAVDYLAGLIDPMASSGNRFVLCLVDHATRYPEATALKGISTGEVAEALTKICSRVGIPNFVLSKRGMPLMLTLVWLCSHESNC